MAAAIILIPEMLSGPDHGKARPEEQGATSESRPASRSDAPIKTYTIDLTQPPGSQPVIAPEDNRAPPPEEAPVPAAPAPSESAERTATNPQPAPQAEPDSSVTAGATSERNAVARPMPPAAPARPLASSTTAPTSGAWAVQLGSFSKQATAERLVRDLKARGHAAFVMPVRSGTATLYRVRIGPLQDRASAETTLRAVQSIVPGAAIVPQP